MVWENTVSIANIMQPNPLICEASDVFNLKVLVSDKIEQKVPEVQSELKWLKLTIS
jgi:hypothetical protein